MFFSDEGLWLDPDWYAQRHSLPSRDQARNHFKKKGVIRNYAPRAEFVREDSPKNRQWAVELMVRRGTRLGSVSAGPKPVKSAEEKAAAQGFDNPERKPIAVVSAVYGPFDRVLPVDPAWMEDADFFLFTDQVFPHIECWNSVDCDYENADTRRVARYVKTHLPSLFAKYEWVLWVDGNVLLCANPKHVADYYAGCQLDFVSFEHPLRSSVVAEAAACHFWQKDNTLSLARDLAQKYNDSEVKDDILFETMVCLAKPGEAHVKAAYEKWWSLIVQGSKRDQLSLPFALKSTPELRYGFFLKPIATSPWFARIRHGN
jgi:hypothetical protein